MEQNNGPHNQTPKRRKRTRGGQPGNRNAMKHGFYSSFLTAAERRKLKEARGIKGVKDDLDFLRVKLGTMSSNPEVTLSQVATAFGVIARLATADHRITGPEREAELLEEFRNPIMEEIAAVMGIEPYVRNTGRYVEGWEDRRTGEGGE